MFAFPASAQFLINRVEKQKMCFKKYGWLLETIHVREVVGLNPGAVFWMDIFNIDLSQNLYCLSEKSENKRKRGRGLPIY